MKLKLLRLFGHNKTRPDFGLIAGTRNNKKKLFYLEYDRELRTLSVNSSHFSSVPVKNLSKMTQRRFFPLKTNDTFFKVNSLGYSPSIYHKWICHRYYVSQKSFQDVN